MIPYGRQEIDEADIDAVVDILRSDWLTQGPQVEVFEESLCQYVKSDFAIAVNSGTSALHLACLAIGLQSGEYLWTTPISFVASANCGLYCGAHIDFVDIEPETQNIDVNKLRDKLIAAKRQKQLPKVIVVIHFAGLPCDMSEIALLSRDFGFHVIEDASHALGAEYNGTMIGSCNYSDITIFSFHPIKSITCGEGGMITTNSKSLADKARLLRSHGITREFAPETHQHGDWYYEQVALGFNFRMTDIQSALGVSQMRRLPGFVQKRDAVAEKYDQALQHFPLELPVRKTDRKSSWHLYVIRLCESDRRKKVFDVLRNAGIGVQVHYIPIHTQPYYQELGFAYGDFPVAENYYSRAISLPIYTSLKNSEQDYVISTLKQALA